MKLVTFELRGGGAGERIGALLDNGKIVDLNAANRQLPPDMVRFLELGEAGLKKARAAIRSARGGSLVEAGQARLLAPLRPPALRDFFAFEEHAKQGAARRGETLAQAWYDQPVYYKGNHREIYGPGAVVPWPSYTRKFDFEHEIAAVVGKKGRDLSPEQAAEHIAGYTILDDFSARDIQKNEMVCRMGPAKGKDFAYGLGPYLLTADELPDPDGLKMAVYVNGEKWSDGSSSGRYWSFPLMLSHVSQEETVYPGDVLGSGTYYKGCGLDLDRWVKPGDTIELEVEKLGRLKQVVGHPKAQKQLRYTKAEAASGARR